MNKATTAQIQKRQRDTAKARWAFPIAEHGRVQYFDVYRSLAGYVRNACGCEKMPTAFAEFLWADFFRSRLPIGPNREDFAHAVDKALKLAANPEAAALPRLKDTKHA